MKKTETSVVKMPKSKKPFKPKPRPRYRLLLAVILTNTVIVATN